MYWLPMVVRSWRGLKAGLKLMGRMMAARLRGSRWVTGGAALQGRMLEAALASGVDIRVASPVSSLVEKNGRICGVVMTIGERQFPIGARLGVLIRSEEHTSELKSLMRISYAVFCLKKKKHNK